VRGGAAGGPSDRTDGSRRGGAGCAGRRPGVPCSSTLVTPLILLSKILTQRMARLFTAPGGPLHCTRRWGAGELTASDRGYPRLPGPTRRSRQPSVVSSGRTTVRRRSSYEQTDRDRTRRVAVATGRPSGQAGVVIRAGVSPLLRAPRW